MRLFLNEINIWIGRLSKIDCPSQCRWASSNSLRGWIEQKCRERENLLFLPDCWAEPLVFPARGLGFIPSALLLLRSLDSDWIYTTSFPGSPTCRQQIEGLSLHNCVSQSYWFCFSGEPWLIQWVKLKYTIIVHPYYTCTKDAIYLKKYKSIH